MRLKRVITALICVILALFSVFIFSSCADEGTYTESEVNALIAALEAENREYKSRIEKLNSDYALKTEELARVERDNAEALEELRTEHEASISELERLVAELEAELQLLRSGCKHSYGDYIDYSGNEKVDCDKRVYYRICLQCGTIEWTCGSYESHSFKTTTVPPTCTSAGYDEMVCDACGKTERVNETPITDHKWKTEYSYDGLYHWYGCEDCDAENSKTEHVVDESGYCTVCNTPLAPTERIIYGISADGTYAEVVDYGGNSDRIVIAKEYKGLPVKKIAREAFMDSLITSVIIHDGITSIDTDAFNSCTRLTSVTMGDGVEIIGNHAFYDCRKITELKIGKNVKIIGAYAFYWCVNLERIYFFRQGHRYRRICVLWLCRSY